VELFCDCCVLNEKLIWIQKTYGAGDAIRQKRLVNSLQQILTCSGISVVCMVRCDDVDSWLHRDRWQERNTLGSYDYMIGVYFLVHTAGLAIRWYLSGPRALVGRLLIYGVSDHGVGLMCSGRKSEMTIAVRLL
jgi:hypothetical protein